MHRHFQSLLALGCAALAFASTGSARDLVEHSPFLPPDFDPGRSNAPEQENRPSTPIERQLAFKGWYEIGGEYRVLVSHQRENNGGWFQIGESRDAITVLDFDPNAEQVRARYQNSEGWVSLAKLGSNPSGGGDGSTARSRRDDSSSSSSARSSSPATRPVRAVSSDRRVTRSAPQRRTVTSSNVSDRSSGSARGGRPILSRAERRSAAEAGGNQPPQTGPADQPSAPPPTESPTRRPAEPPNVENIRLPTR